MPEDPLSRAVGRLEQGWKDFYERIWPSFCDGVNAKLDEITKKVDDGRQAQEDIKREFNGWRTAASERKGAWGMLRAQGMILLRIAQFAVPAGGVGGLVFWLLALVTGHI